MTVSSIIIVGGGTAGWLCANHLGKRFSASTEFSPQITLIDSNEIPPIGVGEGTVPAIRQSLKYLGISETELIRDCDATFKQSVKFIGWNQQSTPNYYHHVFDFPELRSPDQIYSWLASARPETPFTDMVSIQGHLCDVGLGPKLITQPEYAGVANYAYHFDAAKFSQLLMKNATEKYAVKHLKADVEQVKITEMGDIESLATKQLGQLRADLYIDCSGFSSLLLGKSLGVPFVDKSGVLFVDTALAYQIPYESAEAPIPCSTLATAKKAGWIWDIGLSSRRGAGYVYSSSHTTDSAAEQDFARYLGLQENDVNFRKIPMRVGYREKFWQKNCVAIGLSQGFVEPLEATGLLMFDATAKMLAELIPSSSSTFPVVAKQFNKIVRAAWDNVVDFIKLHYCISDRTDSDFWNDNRELRGVPDSLQEKLESWRWRTPNTYDFPNKLGIFHWENYLYVLYGMDFKTSSVHRESENPDLTGQCSRRFTELNLKLDKHRDLINKIKQYGLKKI